MTTTNMHVDLSRARAKRGIDPRRIQMALTPEERQAHDQIAHETGLSDSATAAMIYRLGITVWQGQRDVQQGSL